MTHSALAHTFTHDKLICIFYIKKAKNGCNLTNASACHSVLVSVNVRVCERARAHMGRLLNSVTCLKKLVCVCAQPACARACVRAALMAH